MACPSTRLLATSPGTSYHHTRLFSRRLQYKYSQIHDPYAIRDVRHIRTVARAEKNGDRFFTGFIVGGVIGGLLGWIFAPQISNLLLDENDKLRIPAFLEPDVKETDPEKVRQV
eukprot:jgi/Botrbrau1/7940/Bobra.9_2s0098.2